MTILNAVINVKSAAAQIAAGDVVVVDCRFYLGDEEAGRQAYEAGHIPGAQYAHLNEELSGPLVTGSGRHPLPSVEAMVQLFGCLGISGDKQVIVYDDANGIAAARLWWMLRYMGHEQVAVIDGGMPAWKAAGYELAAGIERNDRLSFSGQVRPELLVHKQDIGSEGVLVDSRAPERYRGEVEPIDPVAGHIPGAVNHFHLKNYDDDGRFLPPSVLRQQFEQLLGDIAPAEATFYCGSGVTACNNLLAMAYAGLGEGRQYVGSWSEWCSDPLNPIALGE